MRHIAGALLIGAVCALPLASNASEGVEWVVWQGQLPPNAIRGGNDQDGRVPLYICRAYHINGLHPGKLLGRHCHIGWGGAEVVLRDFQVLVSGAQPQPAIDNRSGSGRR